MEFLVMEELLQMKYYDEFVIYVYQYLQQEQNQLNQYNEYTKQHSDMKNKQLHILQDLKMIFLKKFLSKKNDQFTF
jgi:hypothetical protein